MIRNIRVRYLLILLFITLVSIVLQLSAQNSAQVQLDYGQTVLGSFGENATSSNTWSFTIQEREMFELRLSRVGGQFSPEMLVFDPNGNVLEPDKIPLQDANRSHFMFMQGAIAGEYRVEVKGEASNNIETPNEYVLSLYSHGFRRASTDEGMESLPERDAEDMPNLETGSASTNDMGVPYYGSANLFQPDARTRRNDWELEGVGGRIEIDNANPLNRGLSSLSIVSEGVGFTMSGGAQFFSDTSISELSYAQSLVNIALANGQTIITDFYRIRQIQAVDNLVIVTTDSEQRLIFEGQSFDFRRRGGINGEGQNAEPINVFKVDDKELETDLSLWHTLYYNSNASTMRVVYGLDMRFVSAYLNVSIYQRGNQEKPELDAEGLDSNYIDIRLSDGDSRTPQSFEFEIDPFAMGDIEIDANTLRISPLDGRVLDESTRNIESVLIEDRAVRFKRLDGSSRISLPDKTDIESPSSIPANRSALPSVSDYRPNNANNLGSFLYDYHPQVNWDEFILPVNPLNGNFSYAVNDVSIPSHVLGLDWTRYYNSLSPHSLTPAYMLSGDYPYLQGQYGNQWRHSYQYELDLRYAPLGEVWMILPDGSRHVFRTGDDTTQSQSPIFHSRTLLSWEVQRQGGFLASWLARTGDGYIYEFDRAGRLQQIQNLDGQVLLFAPAPHDAAQELGYKQGFFVTENYGRRLEIYTDESNLIQMVREQFEFFYHYDGAGHLTKVNYPSVLENLEDSGDNYIYGQDELLTEIRDHRSPYHPEMGLSYLPDGRVQSWAINIDERDNMESVSRQMTYEVGQTISSLTQGDVQQNHIVHYDSEQRITRYVLSDSTTTRTRGFEYDGQSGLLYQVKQVNGASISYTYDNRGYLTLLRLPSTREYKFAYRTGTDGVSRWLTEIRYPNNSASVLTYDESNNHLLSISKTLDSGRNLISQFEYDANGRVSRILEPNPANELAPRATEFVYDNYAYLKQVQVYDSANPDLRYTLQTEFNLRGNLIEIVDWRGNPISIDWDNQRNLIIALTYGDISRNVKSTSYSYDKYSNLVERNVDGLIESFTYNGLNLLATVNDGMGRVYEYRYDNFGNLIERIEPSGTEDNPNLVKIFQYRYNGIDELIAYILPNGESYLLDYQIEGTGVPTYLSVRTPNGEMVRYTYDVDNRLSAINQFGSNNLATYSYLFQYDVQGNLSSLQEQHGSTRTRSARYNAIGLPLSIQMGEAETRYEYNHAGYLAKMINPDGAITEYAYDMRGYITNVILPDNDFSANTALPTYSYQYDEAGNLVTFIDALQHTSSYTYDELNRLISYKDPDGFFTEYNYDAHDNLVSVIYPNDTIIRAEYNEANQMIRWIDATGLEIEYSYDDSNRLRQEETLHNNFESNFTYDVLDNMVAWSLPENRETLFSYDKANRLISETNALGQTIVYNYNNLGRISRIVDSLGNIEHYTWTSIGRLSSYTNQAGNTFTYASDSIGRLGQITAPKQERFILDYSAGGLLEELRHHIDSDSDIYEFTYYPNGLIASMQSPTMEQATTFSYDPMQRLTSIRRGSTGDEISYTYDAQGQITQIDYPDGSTESFEYDSVGNVTTHTSQNGMVSRFQYDANNRISSREDSFNEISRRYQYIYNQNAPQLLVRDPFGMETKYYFDRFGNIERINVVGTREDGEEQEIDYKYGYDNLNNLIEISYPSINSDGTRPSQNFSYNALNQLTRYLDPAGGSWAYSYDELNNLSQINDPLGNVVAYVYDENNRIQSITYNSGAYAEFEYDVAFNTLSVPENRSHDRTERIPILYKFDFSGDIVEIKHDPHTITFERDDMGRVAQMRTANNAQISFEYNYRNQLTSVTTPQGRTNYLYDSSGNLVNISGSGQTTELAYDGFSYLTQYLQGSLRINYGRDVLGRLESLESSIGHQMTYGYDVLSRLVSVESGDESVQFSRNEIGWETARQYSSGLSQRYIYDEAGRIINFSTSSTSRYLFQYQYDDVGNVIRTSRNDRDEASRQITRDTIYTYGRNNELIGERWLNENNEVVYAVTYTYDLVGNRIQSTNFAIGQNPSRTLYIYNNKNQLVEELRGVPIEGTDEETAIDRESAQMYLTYTYDNAGNLTSTTHLEGTLNYGYDVWNRLTSVKGINEQGQAIDVSITYSNTGQISHLHSGDISYSLFYDETKLIAIQNDTNDTIETYHYSSDGDLLWREIDGQREYPIIDALDNLRLWVKADGSSSDGLRGLSVNGFGNIINPYGDLSSEITNNAPILLYGGQLYEPSSGLYLMGVRAYSPVIGRFIQRDPVRHDPQSSLYTYSQNRPTFFTDNSGMIAEAGFVAAGAIEYPQSTLTYTPQSLIPEDTQTFGRIMQAQARELNTMLSVANTLQEEFNPTAIGLNRAYCLRVSGSTGASFQNQWLPQLELEGISNAFVPNYEPRPDSVPAQNTVLNDVNLLASMTASGRNACGLIIQAPDIDEARPSSFIFEHQNLRNQLDVHSMFSAFGEEINFLLDADSYQPQLMDMQVEPRLQSLPLPAVLPDILYGMQVDTYTLMQGVLLPLYPLDLPPSKTQKTLDIFPFNQSVWER